MSNQANNPEQSPYSPTGTRLAEFLRTTNQMDGILQGMEDCPDVEELDRLLERSNRLTTEICRLHGALAINGNPDDVIDVSAIEPSSAALFVLVLAGGPEPFEPHAIADLLENLEPDEVVGIEYRLKQAREDSSDPMHQIARRIQASNDEQYFMLRPRIVERVDTSQTDMTHLQHVLDALAGDEVPAERVFTDIGQQVLRLVSYRDGDAALDEMITLINFDKSPDQRTDEETLRQEIERASSTLSDQWRAGQLDVVEVEEQNRIHYSNLPATEQN